MFAPPYEQLSRFAGNLATCLEAGVETTKSLENAARSLAGTPLSGAMQVALTRVGKGTSLAAALAAVEWGLPPFFVPMIEAGEQTGRLDESLRYLEHHCKLLAGPARTLRNVWLLPLTIALIGTAIKLVAHLCLATWGATLSFFFSSLTSYAMLGVIAFVVLSSPVKPLLDQLKLLLPIVSDVEKEVAANRFFHALAMLYAAGGRRVEGMIEFSARGVANIYLRRDYLSVAERIKRRDSLPAAFQAAEYIPQAQQELIESGDLSGTLEKSFERISRDTAEQLGFRIDLFNRIFTRLMALMVVYSIALTLLGLLKFI